MLQYKSVIYKNLTINQQDTINIFIQKNFPEIKIDHFSATLSFNLSLSNSLYTSNKSHFFTI